jgi:hypothetical protein
MPYGTHASRSPLMPACGVVAKARLGRRNAAASAAEPALIAARRETGNLLRVSLLLIEPPFLTGAHSEADGRAFLLPSQLRHPLAPRSSADNAGPRENDLTFRRPETGNPHHPSHRRTPLIRDGKESVLA